MGKQPDGSSQVIATPKSGGALHGIGEKFSPDLQMGTGNFTVPIDLLPGRNGFNPQISLAYSTGNGNGPFGLGWHLSIPGVTRKTSKGVPLYNDSTDTFILSGAEDLVPVEDLDIRTRYRPRTEGLFARIIHNAEPGNDYWEVRSKDGLVSFYGTPRLMNAPQSWRDPAVIRNPDPLKSHHIFAWKLTRTVDAFGNRIDYLYERDAVQSDGPHQWDQLYLSEIRYADYSAADKLKFLVTVKFVYEDRPDPYSEYRAGFEIRTIRRCTRIETSTHASKDALTRAYHLVYLDQRSPLPQPVPLNGFSLLSILRVVGHDGSAVEELPPLEFGYTGFNPERREFSAITGSELPPNSLADPNYELVDLFGAGLPDILELNGTARYWRNLGGGRFDVPRPMRDAPAGLALADKGVQLIDANGDGCIDLLVTTGGLSGYFPLRFGGGWDRRSFRPYAVAPSFNLEDQEVKLFDVDGDGVTDAMRSGERMEVFLNDPEHGWRNTRRIERQALDVFPNVNFSDPRIKLGDMTADGVQDIVLVHDSNVEYWPNLGHGNWGERIQMRNSPRLPLGCNPRRILLGDVDGDGLADIVYVDDTRVTLWINKGGNGWSDPIVVEGTSPVTDLDEVRLVDVLGNGVAGVLWSSNRDDQSRSRMFFLDFTGGMKPYLLNEMDNHIGAITRVQYGPSTRFYLEDQEKLETRWQTRLPLPVQVVARVEVIDEISSSKLTTEFRYRNGHWDGAERDFRGFARVDVFDTEIFAEFHASGLHPNSPVEAVSFEAFSPPTEKRIWFELGPIGDEFGEWEEADFKSEYWPGDPQALTRPSSVTGLLKALPRRVKRDALRTLRGTIKRSELYALDNTTRQDRPYTVTESLFGVCAVVDEGSQASLVCNQNNLPEDWKTEATRQRIFFPHALGDRTTQWDRGQQPMTQFSFTDDYDSYGNPRSQIDIAVPRDRDFEKAVASGERYLATSAITDFIYRDDDQHYLVGRVARTTSHEILNDGSVALFDLLAAIRNDTVTKRILGQTVNFYDGLAFEGLPFGQLGDYGALVRSESLAFTPEILREAYRDGADLMMPPEEPPYLMPAGPIWPAEYPKEFRDRVPPLAGYHFRPASPYAGGYYIASRQEHYDFHASATGQGRGLVTATRDALGRDTRIAYDSFDLLPISVTDPAGLSTTASYDYRVLQPTDVTEPNGNRSSFTYTPLGLLDSTALIGRLGEGDTLAVPGVCLVYDFLAFLERNEPISVRTVKRVHHVNDSHIPLPERDETIESIEYSDGFGRLLQIRTQAEDEIFGDPVFGGALLPADQSAPVGDTIGQPLAASAPPNVVVSGWQIYDNKGRVVEKYEPFFSNGWAYVERTDAERGQKAKMFYDPPGRVIRTVNPDGSEQRVVYGVPGEIGAPDLSDPSQFEPTPWEAYTYDPNDNAGRTRSAQSQSYQAHWNTPSSIVIDALGRTVQAVARNGPDPATDWYTTQSTYDIQGNLLTVNDALGRVAFKFIYDLVTNALRTESIDAGLRRTVLDATGNPLEGRDSKGALILHAYDIVNRRIRLWACDEVSSPVTLRERMSYGDSTDSGLSASQAANANLLGRPYKHYDEAGVRTVTAYDFKGNPLEKTRQVIGDEAILAVFNPPPPHWQVPAFRVDWDPPNGVSLAAYATGLLDPNVYQTSLEYDGLNRIESMRYPMDVLAQRKELRPQYNRAGALEQVTLDGASYVESIAYNAKGQRLLIAYGNGVITRQAYDPQTFRLARMRTERYTKPADLTYQPTGAPLQDFAYVYDLAGNILSIRDRTPGSGVPNTVLDLDALDRVFTYDPLYQLLSATGREHAIAPSDAPWADTVKSQDPTLTRSYTEKYVYDRVGNIGELRHVSNGGSFTRGLALAPGSNRLSAVSIGVVEFDHNYDPNGNLIRETTSRHFEWDHGDRMRVYRTQAGTAEPSIYVNYFYDAGGQRAKKLLRNSSGQFEITIYVDGVFEHHRIVQGAGTVQENNTLHVVDDLGRIALMRVGAPFAEDTAPAVKFQLRDHLGSSNVIVGNNGDWINREEYAPYGETSFGGFARKRYRCTGMEREESGLYYHGARYYAPWLARWTSSDPLGMVDGINTYAYVSNNPVCFFDRSGTNGEGGSGQGTAPEPEGQKVIKAPEDTSGVSYDTNDPSCYACASSSDLSSESATGGPAAKTFGDGPSLISSDFVEVKEGGQKISRTLLFSDPFYLTPEAQKAGETIGNTAGVVGLATSVAQEVLKGGLSTFTGVDPLAPSNSELLKAWLQTGNNAFLWDKAPPLGTNLTLAETLGPTINIIGVVTGAINVVAGAQTLADPTKGPVEKVLAGLNVGSGVVGAFSSKFAAGAAGTAGAIGTAGALAGAFTAGYAIGTIVLENTAVGKDLVSASSGAWESIDNALTGPGQRSFLLRAAEWID